VGAVAMASFMVFSLLGIDSMDAFKVFGKAAF